MRIEHLKEFDIRGHERHQVAFASTLELRRGERAQLAEHSIADERQDLERKIVVAHLLAVMRKRPQAATKAMPALAPSAGSKPAIPVSTKAALTVRKIAHRKPTTPRTTAATMTGTSGLTSFTIRHMIERFDLRRV